MTPHPQLPKQTPEFLASKIVSDCPVDHIIGIGMHHACQKCIEKGLRQALEAERKRYDQMLKKQHEIQHGLVKDIQHYTHVAEDVERLEGELEAAQKQLLTLTPENTRLKEDLDFADEELVKKDVERLQLVAENAKMREALIRVKEYINQARRDGGYSVQFILTGDTVEKVESALSTPPSEALSVVKEVAGALRISANQFRHAINGNSIDRKCIEGCAHCVVDKAIAHFEKVFGRLE